MSLHKIYADQLVFYTNRNGNTLTLCPHCGNTSVKYLGVDIRCKWKGHTKLYDRRCYNCLICCKYWQLYFQRSSPTKSTTLVVGIRGKLRHT